jgi:DNA-binding transcriptional ArsR family regulator
MKSLPDAVARLHARLALLADRSRFRVLLVVAGGPVCVTAVAREVGLAQSTATRHLQALHAAGWVSRQREGRQVRFEVAEEARGWLTGLGLASAVGEDPVPATRPGTRRDPDASGITPAPVPSDLEPTAPARRSTLEDFLL